jgi:hypothetical protein
MGELDLSYGWSHEHGGEKNNELKLFVVTSGWETMADFESAVKTEVFKEAIPILIEWEAPFELVSCLTVSGHEHANKSSGMLNGRLSVRDWKQALSRLSRGR